MYGLPKSDAVPRSLFGLSLCIFLAVVACRSQAQGSKPDPDPTALTTLADFRDLSDDASPEQLFDKVIAYSEAERAKKAVPANEPFALPKGFVFPVNANRDGGKDRKNSIFCIDISHYTSLDLDFNVLKEISISCVDIKASQGTGYKDSHFKDFCEAAADAGVARGAYHFVSSQSSGEDQGKSFAKLIALNGGFKATDLPPAVDLEWDISYSGGLDHWVGQSSKQIIDKVLACLDAIEKATEAAGAHKIPILYTSNAWIKERGISASDFARLRRFNIWIADYSRSHRAIEKPSQVFGLSNLFWQFAADTTLQKGYNGKLDANIYYGSRTEFERDFQLTAQQH